MLSPTTIKQSLPRSTKRIQIVGISNESQKASVSEPAPFCLGPLRETNPIILSSSTLQATPKKKIFKVL